jgi:hypothetical protein
MLEDAVGCGGELGRCEDVAVCRIRVAGEPDFACPAVDWLKDGDV